MKKIAEAGDVILIDGGNERESYIHYINKSIIINKPLSIQAFYQNSASTQQMPSIVCGTKLIFDKRNPAFFVMSDLNITDVKISMMVFINAVFILRHTGGCLNLQNVILHYEGDGIPFQVLRGDWDIKLLRCTYTKPARVFPLENLQQNYDIDNMRKGADKGQVNLIVEDTLLIRYSHVFLTTNANLTSYYRNTTFLDTVFVESGSNLTTVQNCTMKNSSLVLQFIEYAILSDVVFDGNGYLFMQLEIKNVRKVDVDNCIFKNAHAGVFDVQTSSVKVTQTNITDNSQSQYLSRKSTLNFFNSNLKVIGCHFENNTSSSIAPGTLSFIDTDNNYFGAKHLTIDSTTIVGESPQVTGNPVFDIQLSDDVFTLKNASIFSCPLNSYYRYFEDDAGRNFVFTCVHCQWRMYNVMQQAQMVWNDTASKYQHHNIKCLNCPSTAVCEAEVKSKGHYWGYIGVDNSILQFIPCPFRYCCSSLTKCKSYNSCNNHRQGRLCNKCMTGFSVSFFGSFDCIETAKCYKWYFWYLFICIGFVFLLTIMYLKDMGIILKRLLVSKENNTANNKTIVENIDRGLIDGHCNNNEITRRLLSDSNENDDEEEITRRLLMDDSSEMESSYQELRSHQCIPSGVYTKQSVLVTGCIKIIFFFYQAASIIRIESPSKQLYYTPWIFDGLNSFFNVRIQSTSSAVNICPIPNASIVQIGLLKSSFLFVCPLFFLIIMYVVTKLMLRLKNSNQRRTSLLWYASIDDEIPSYFKLPFLIRIKCTYVQLVLLSFSSIATYLLESVNCVQILEGSYLYIQASTKCYTWWQYVNIIVIIIWIGLFPFCLHYACCLLHKCFINPTQFLLVPVFPPLVLLYFLKEKYTKYEHVLCESDAIEAKHILRVINEPFRVEEKQQNDYQSRKAIVWEPVLIMRRILLVLVNVLLIQPCYKIFPSGLLLIGYLLHHVFKKPFQDERLNQIETISLSTLCFLNMTNIFWSFSDQLDMQNSNVLKFVGKVILYFELVVLCLPFVVLLVVAGAVLVKKLYKLYIRKQN